MKEYYIVVGKSKHDSNLLVSQLYTDLQQANARLEIMKLDCSEAHIFTRFFEEKATLLQDLERSGLLKK